MPRFPQPHRSLAIRILLIAGGIVIALMLSAALLYSFLFGPANLSAVPQDFVVTPEDNTVEISLALEEAGIIKHAWAFQIAALMQGTMGGIRPGGYRLSGDMDLLSVVDTLSKAPYFAWVTIPHGLRAEQVTRLLADTLGWSAVEIAEFEEAQASSPDFAEGVYYPDTYLIASDQAPADVEARLRAKFQDQFASYAAEATQDGLEWGDVLTLASLVERESAQNDKALVAGILWNRLNKNMLLQVDATLQYMSGSELTGWWVPPDPDTKFIDSPFNTYMYAGLPPKPIASPSLASVEAALNPTKTSCLYYIHDVNGRIHCSPTYKGHVANVNRYLR